jgi:hypothetical protein
MAEYEDYWKRELESLRTESKDLINESPEARDVIERVLNTLDDIVSLASCTPTTVGQSQEWAGIVSTAQEDKEKLCTILQGKGLFSALYGVYSLTLANLKTVLQNSVGRDRTVQNYQNPVLRNPRQRQKGSEKREATLQRKAQLNPNYRHQFQNGISSPPLNSVDMDIEDKAGDEGTKGSRQPPKCKGRTPPIIITTNINLIKTQREFKTIMKEDITLRNTRNGVRITTRTMDDYSVLKTHLDNNQTHYFTYHPKAEKPIQVVIRHLPGETPAEDIANKLLALGYKVRNVRQMTTTRQQSEGGRQIQALPLFLVTLERDEKSYEIYKLTNLNHIFIQVEAYRARTGLTQCYNCQQFGHVWANCKQPPRCLWCGGGQRHNECPEKENQNSSPHCCNCKLAEGERPHPANYRGCKLAKDEMLRRRTPQTESKNTTGRNITPRYTTQLHHMQPH